MSIRRHVDAFVKVQEAKNQLVETLRGLLDRVDLGPLRRQGFEKLSEDRLVRSFEASDVTGKKIVSVDGGYQSRRFANFVFLLARAIGGVFRFFPSETPRVKYYPHASQNFRVEVFHKPQAIRAHDVHASVERATMEVELVNRILDEEDGVDLVIMDGSVLAEGPDGALDDDEASAKYSRLLREYYKLYRRCVHDGVLLAGCVKDSQSCRVARSLSEALPMLVGVEPALAPLLNYHYRDVLAYFNDQALFRGLLDVGQRSCTFRASPNQKPLGSLKVDFFAFYARFSAEDDPLRVEFLVENDPSAPASASVRADALAGALHPLSSSHRAYSVPTPQIEVHRRAKVTTQDLEFHLSRFLGRLSPADALSLTLRRRDRRPF
ncbi:MAG: hypothetical protein Kow0069_35480 [Promethearchaeota archaeon]